MQALLVPREQVLFSAYFRGTWQRLGWFAAFALLSMTGATFATAEKSTRAQDRVQAG